MNEDNFYIKYFCKSLESYMQNYQKQYYGLYIKGSKDKKYKIKRCQLCGKMIEKSHNRKIYCDDCRENMRLNRYKKYNQKRHNHN